MRSVLGGGDRQLSGQVRKCGVRGGEVAMHTNFSFASFLVVDRGNRSKDSKRGRDRLDPSIAFIREKEAPGSHNTANPPPLRLSPPPPRRQMPFQVRQGGKLYLNCAKFVSDRKKERRDRHHCQRSKVRNQEQGEWRRGGHRHLHRPSDHRASNWLEEDRTDGVASAAIGHDGCAEPPCLSPSRPAPRFGRLSSFDEEEGDVEKREVFSQRFSE